MCGSFICSICAIEIRGEIVCPRCLKKELSRKGGVPLDSPKGGFFFISILKTLQGILLSPRYFFDRMGSFKGYMRFAIYGTLMKFLGLSSSFLVPKIQLTPLSYIHRFLFPYILSPIKTQAGLYALYPLIIVYFLLIVSLLSLFLRSAVSTLTLLALGNRNIGFHDIFRISSYASTASILSFIPGGGDLVYAIWEVVLMYIGLKRGVKINPLHSFVSAISPFIFLIILPLISTSLILLFFKMNLGLS